MRQYTTLTQVIATFGGSNFAPWINFQSREVVSAIGDLESLNALWEGRGVEVVATPGSFQLKPKGESRLDRAGLAEVFFDVTRPIWLVHAED